MMNTELTTYPGESRLATENVSVIEVAKSLVVTNEADYQSAGEYLKAIKRQQKAVTEFFEPMRVSSKAAYDAVLSRKKAMLDPLKDAEAALKEKLDAFIEVQKELQEEKNASLKERAARRLDECLAEAAAAEKAGDVLAAEMALAEAEMMDDAANGVGARSMLPKVNGISTVKSWEIISIDHKAVPAYVGDVVIRPVDEKAVMTLIKATKGQVVIPGVQFKETVSHRVRT